MEFLPLIKIKPDPAMRPSNSKRRRPREAVGDKRDRMGRKPTLRDGMTA
jgi:hypothetical protein